MSLIFSLVIVIIWHLFALFFSTHWDCQLFRKDRLSDSEFKKNCKREKFYNYFFKIKKWKNKVPEYSGRNSLSKSNKKFVKKKFESCNINYIREFITATYLGEIYHEMSFLITPFLFFLFPVFISVIFSVILVIINLPCILIQRYNRARLRKLVILKMARNNIKKLKI
jgi:glycosyl-4,4'-diaponeurosporenoate acyltransferase